MGMLCWTQCGLWGPPGRRWIWKVGGLVVTQGHFVLKFSHPPPRKGTHYLPAGRSRPGWREVPGHPALETGKSSRGGGACVCSLETEVSGSVDKALP